VGQLDDRSHRRMRISIGHHVSHEAAVDFQLGYLQTLKRRQRIGPGSEVIERELAAEYDCDACLIPVGIK
jgi:hypothetical protein